MEFACDNGDCFPMSVRCNEIMDCDDESDEKACALIQVQIRGHWIIKVELFHPLCVSSNCNTHNRDSVQNPMFTLL